MALIANPYDPFPSFQKTWQFNVNQLVDAETTASLQAASTMLTYLNSWLGFPLNPWTMRRCCDSVTVKTDGTNLFTDKTKFVGAAAGTAHSWFVVRNPSGQEVCVDFSSASGAYLAGEYVSASAGFTGGTTTNRPTATDERQLRGSTASPSQWLAGTAGVNVRLRVHVMHSTDGLSTVSFVTYQQVALSMLQFGRVAEPVSGWSAPVMALWAGTQSTGSLTSTFAQTWTNFRDFQLHVADGPSGQMDIRVTPKIGASSNGQTYSSTKDSLIAISANRESGYSGRWGLRSFGYFSRTSGMIGRHGKAVDKWFTASGLPGGTVFNASDGVRSLAVIGNWVLPWPVKTAPFFY